MNQSWMLLLAVATGCTDDDFPAPPDLSELERAYAEPTATAGDAAELGALANAVVAIDRVLGRGDVVIEGSGGVLADPAAPADTAKPLPYDLRGVGIVQITHVCPGWPEHEARRADLTGQLELSVRFELGDFVPVLWGVADRCAFEVDGRRVSADGDLIVARIDRGILVALTGLLAADGEVLVDDALDFVVRAEGVDYRKQVGDGHVVITIGRDGRLVVHAADGDFTCDAERCTREGSR